ATPACEPLPEEVWPIDWYLQAAAGLQAVGRDEACKRLRALASYERLSALLFEEQDREEEKLFVLCRMLFTAKPGGEFRRPATGGAGFCGDTKYEDWPLDPIEVVGGIPFKVARAKGALAGTPERPDGYLSYCIQHCDWSPVGFGPKS